VSCIVGWAVLIRSQAAVLYRGFVRSKLSVAGGLLYRSDSCSIGCRRMSLICNNMRYVV
jgi:hypothetical protein